ncbi:MAG: hypothetical protein MK085_00065 [Phycisphaerales bacterium]|nr:hypothetical protein [Phycisphaerales bacterium]
MIRPTEQGFRRKEETPRRVRNGIRMVRRDQDGPYRWPASAWFKLVAGEFSSALIDEGLEFAKKGQTSALTVEPARIVAKVQDIKARPHIVQVEFPPINRADWDRVVASMAKEARYTAKLVTGEISPDFVEPFAAAGMELIPNREDIRVECDCGGTPCRHVATIAHLVAERMEADPLMILTLRGLHGPRFLERLQEARFLATSGMSRAHPVPPVASKAREMPKPEERLSSFWSAGAALGEFERSGSASHVPHALLRRLGATPIEGKFPFVGLLASIYDSVAEVAREDQLQRDSNAAEAGPPPPRDEEA